MPVPIELLNGASGQARTIVAQAAAALAGKAANKGALGAGEPQVDLEQLKREMDSAKK